MRIVDFDTAVIRFRGQNPSLDSPSGELLAMLLPNPRRQLREYQRLASESPATLDALATGNRHSSVPCRDRPLQRDLPECFGKWNSVFRFDRWSQNDVWRRVMHEVQAFDLDRFTLNSTTARAPARGGTKSILKPKRHALLE